MHGSREGLRCRAPGESTIRKVFTLRASYRLELELRLERFNDALEARGGGSFAVARGRAPNGEYTATVYYHLPLSRDPAPVGHFRAAMPCIDESHRAARGRC